MLRILAHRCHFRFSGFFGKIWGLVPTSTTRKMVRRFELYGGYPGRSGQPARYLWRLMQLYFTSFKLLKVRVYEKWVVVREVTNLLSEQAESWPVFAPGDKMLSWPEFFLALNRRVYLAKSAPNGGDNSWMAGKSY